MRAAAGSDGASRARSALMVVTTLGVVVLGLAHVAYAADADFKCRETIDKEFTKYVKTVTKIVQKCNDTVVKSGSGSTAPGGSNINGCDTNGKIPVALQKMSDKITAKCGDQGITPSMIGWPATCPNFEGGSCTNAITDSASIATCLDCIGKAAIAQAMDLYYASLTNGGTDSHLIKCQQSIGKETSKFLLAKDKALTKCRGNLD